MVQKPAGVRRTSGRLRRQDAAVSAAQLRIRSATEPVQLRAPALGLSGATRSARRQARLLDVVSLALVLIRWFLVAIAIAACGRSDRNVGSSTQAGSPSVGMAGPQALVLRVSRAGGTPRVYAYPKVDSAVWRSSDPAPTPAHVL